MAKFFGGISSEFAGASPICGASGEMMVMVVQESCLETHK